VATGIIVREAQTGKEGDGQIFVSNVEEVIDIGSGDEEDIVPLRAA